MLLRLIAVLLGLFAAAIVIRTLRALVGRPRAPRGAGRSGRPALDPEKRVQATWSDVSLEREERGMD
jgi:hypothetical protein